MVTEKKKNSPSGAFVCISLVFPDELEFFSCVVFRVVNSSELHAFYLELQSRNKYRKMCVLFNNSWTLNSFPSCPDTSCLASPMFSVARFIVIWLRKRKLKRKSDVCTWWQFPKGSRSQQLPFFAFSDKLITHLLLWRGFLAAAGALLQGPLALRGLAASKLPLHTKLLLKIIQQQVRAVLNF